jgi:hypothetical protein
LRSKNFSHNQKTFPHFAEELSDRGDLAQNTHTQKTNSSSKGFTTTTTTFTTRSNKLTLTAIAVEKASMA